MPGRFAYENAYGIADDTLMFDRRQITVPIAKSIMKVARDMNCGNLIGDYSGCMLREPKCKWLDYSYAESYVTTIMKKSLPDYTDNTGYTWTLNNVDSQEAVNVLKNAHKGYEESADNPFYRALVMCSARISRYSSIVRKPVRGHAFDDAVAMTNHQFCPNDKVEDVEADTYTTTCLKRIPGSTGFGPENYFSLDQCPDGWLFTSLDEPKLKCIRAGYDFIYKKYQRLCVRCPIDQGAILSGDRNAFNGESKCICPENTFGRKNSLTDYTSCNSCAAGKYMINSQPLHHRDSADDCNLCPKNTIEVDGACVSCPEGLVSLTGDKECTCPDGFYLNLDVCTPCESGISPVGSNVCFCEKNFHGSENGCIPCSENSFKAEGSNPFVPDNCGCLENYRVIDNKCVLCPLDSINEPGDNPEGDDTICKCPKNYHVFENSCRPCPTFYFPNVTRSTRAAGDNPDGIDTSCGCPENYFVYYTKKCIT